MSATDYIIVIIATLIGYAIFAIVVWIVTTYIYNRRRNSEFNAGRNDARRDMITGVVPAWKQYQDCFHGCPTVPGNDYRKGYNAVSRKVTRNVG